MRTSTITQKGQITIPVELRHALDLRTGDAVEFRLHDGEISLTKQENKIEAAFGLLKASKSVSLSDMEQAIQTRGKK